MKKLKDENYAQIQGWMINRLELEGPKLLIYSVIYGFSQIEGQDFNGSLRYLMEWTRKSKPTVIKALKDLVSEGLISKRTEEKRGVTFCFYRALPGVKKFNRGGKETLPGGGKEILPNNNILDNTINNNIKKLNKKEDDYQLSEAENDFENFWEIMLKRGSKKKAKSRFLNLPKKTQKKILEAAPQFVATVRDVQYMPHAITWLNGERWEDEIALPVLPNKPEGKYDKSREALIRAGRELMDEMGLGQEAN